MKKLGLVLVAIIGIATVSSGATVLWNGDTFRITDSSGTLLTQAQMVAMTGSFVLYNVTQDVEMSAGVTAATLNTTNDSGTKKGGLLQGGTFDSDIATVALNDVITMMYKDGGTLFALAYAGGAPVNAYQFLDSTNADPPGPNLDYTLTGNFYVVPEPTSMALLALGLVALGLRRRR